MNTRLSKLTGSIRPISQWLSAIAVTPLLLVTATAIGAGSVTVNGTSISGAEGRIDESVAVVEFRDGQTGLTHLVPGPKNYAIAVLAGDPIALFDAQLPVGATATRFIVVFDFARTFYQCLVTGLKSAEKGVRSEEYAGAHRFVYSLRCEDTSS